MIKLLQLKVPDAREASAYLSSIWLYVLIAAVVFFGSIAAGYWYSRADPEAVKPIIEEIVKEFGEFRDYSIPLLILRIFAQNALLSLIMIVLGFGLGVLCLFFIVYNGIMIGLVVYEVERNFGLTYIIAGLVPHGVIEVPLILISTGIGMRLGFEVIRALLGEKDLFLFSWDEIPGKDSATLIELLRQKFGIVWVELAKVEKIDDNRSIRIFSEKNSVSLVLNDKRTKATLRAEGSRTEEFTVKLENGRLNAYRSVSIMREFKKGLRIYIFWIVPLLFIAALVEVLITPVVIFIAANNTDIIATALRLR